MNILYGTSEIPMEFYENLSEEKREDSEGKSVSYNPPRYIFCYDFDILIRVNHPYFDQISFQLNSSDVDLNRGNPLPMMRKPDPRMNPDYREYETMGNEIKRALTSARRQAREEARQAAAPKQAVTCPWCGATTTPDASGCCEYCGGSVNG